MDFNTLLELVGDNQEATTFLKEIQETQNSNVLTINKNETLINALKGDLDKFKQGNNLVKTKLGLEQLNEDSLSEALNSLKKDGSNVKEIENLQKILNETNTKLTETESKYVSQIRDLKVGTQLKDIITKAGIIPEAIDDAYSIAKSMLNFDSEHNPVFLNEDGTTKYLNGKPMNIGDLPNVLRETKSYMFPRDTKSGGGSTTNQGGSTQGKLGGTAQEEEAYIKAKFNK